MLSPAHVGSTRLAGPHVPVGPMHGPVLHAILSLSPPTPASPQSFELLGRDLMVHRHSPVSACHWPDGSWPSAGRVYLALGDCGSGSPELSFFFSVPISRFSMQLATRPLPSSSVEITFAPLVESTRKPLHLSLSHLSLPRYLLTFSSCPSRGQFQFYPPFDKSVDYPTLH